MNVDTVLYNSTPEKIANISQNKRGRVRAINFEAARIHFLGNVFAAVAVAVVVGARFEGEERARVLITRDRSSCATYFL